MGKDGGLSVFGVLGTVEREACAESEEGSLGLELDWLESSEQGRLGAMELKLSAVTVPASIVMSETRI